MPSSARKIQLPLGAVPTADTPPIFFLRHQKDCARKRVSEANRRKAAALRPATNAPCPVEKKKCLNALRYSGPSRDGGRRTGASVDLAWPTGTLGSSASLQLPSCGGWRRRRRGARTHLNCPSFRAFRFTHKGYAASVSGRAANGCAAATRCPGSHEGLCHQ